MNNTFKHKDKTYEIRKTGVEYIKKNSKNCIGHENNQKFISIDTALAKGLILEINPTTEAIPFPKENFTAVDSGTASSGILYNSEAVKELLKEEPIEIANIRPKDSIYFMPVDQIRAQVFLAHGLIYPTIYDKSSHASNFNDYQTQTPNDLTLFDKPQLLYRGQLLLKILVFPEEVNGAKKTVGKIQIAHPLPISRLVGIEVPESIGSLERYIDGWIKPDVPVVRHLFTSTKFLAENFEKEKKLILNEEMTDSEFNAEVLKSISKYDRYLGIMAFLRNTDRYFSEKTGLYADYPDVFISLCERILDKAESTTSPLTKSDALLLTLLDIDSNPTPFAQETLTLIESNEPFIEKEKAKSIALEIYKTSDKKEFLATTFDTLFNSNDYRTAIRHLQSLDVPDEAAIISTLYKFSKRLSNDHLIVKERLHEDWSNIPRACLTLATLGGYYGYTAMHARETSIFSVHPLIDDLIEKKPPIKFHLETNYERQVIESLYKKAFFPGEKINDRSNSFSHICPLPYLKTSPVTPWGVSDTSYTIQDLKVYQYKVTLIGRIIQRLKSWKRDFIDEKTQVGQYLGLVLFDIADESESHKKNGKRVRTFRIAKSKVIDLIKNGTISFNAEVLDKALEVDVKAN